MKIWLTHVFYSITNLLNYLFQSLRQYTQQATTSYIKFCHGQGKSLIFLSILLQLVSTHMEIK